MSQPDVLYIAMLIASVAMCLCRGSFSQVFLVREKKTGDFYALKCVKKKVLHHSNLENEITVLRK